jgi:uncharacterized membrane protein YeaQ/YmgE (transglycosylase-associated protein family)
MACAAALAANRNSGKVIERWSARGYARREVNIMQPESLIVFMVIGLIAGWIAGKVVRGTGFGLIGDMAVGIIGALIAGWLFPKIGVGTIVNNAFLNNVASAALGAIILLIVLRLVKR